MRRRLHLRLYLAFLGVLLVVTLVTSAINFRIFGVRRGGLLLAAHVGQTLGEDLDRSVDDVHEALGVDLAVIDSKGDLIAEAGSPIPAPPPDWLQRARNGPTWAPGFIAAAPVRTSPGSVVLVRLPVRGGTRAVLRPLLLVAAVLLVSFALVYPLSRSITRPLEKLTSVVEAYGRGDLSRRSGLGELPDEVGKLARTFDEMADRVETKRRAEKQLLANVSHELRTPLARMKVALELMQSPDEASRRRVGMISEEVDELDRLVGDLLAAARLDASALPLRKQRLRASEIVSKASERAQALSPALPLEARVDGALELEGDEGLLARALDNLIDNARKYADGAAIEVEAVRDGGEAVFSVRDRGPGIPTEEIDRIFDPFYRGGAARGVASGFGLGLALARKVAEAHGGTARASNAIGGGARIELRVPAV